MSQTAKISSKGQVTIPLAVRRRLGLSEGDRIEFVLEEGRTIIRPVRQDNPFAAFAGILADPQGSPRTAEELRDWLDEIRSDE